MSVIIEDGTGKGYKAKVDKNGQVSVKASTQSEASFISHEQGGAYIIATGSFTSVTSGESGLLYIKYTGDKQLHIANVRTCGTGVQKWRMYKDVTTGTLVSGANAASVNNANITSKNVLDEISYKGVDGSTITDGTVMDQWINNGGHSSEEFDGIVVLGKGDSIAFSCEVSSSIDVCIRVICFEAEV